MPIQIDRMDTTIDMTAPATATPPRGAPTPAPPASDDTLRERICDVLRADLEDFLRQRGL